MQTLDTGVLLNASSNVFHTNVPTKCWVRVSGTFSSQTVTLMESLAGSTYATFNTDGTDQTFTAATYKLYDLPGGVDFRFDVSNGGSPSINVHVGGPGIELS